jgi:hypothetical protein
VSTNWLPPLVLLEDSHGNWDAYEEILYGWFTQDFVTSRPTWPGKRVGLKRHPLSKGKEATFWHFISDGRTEEDRVIDIRRCERICWPRPVMEAFTNRRPTAADPVVWWKNTRKGETSYLIGLPDFSYLIVVRDRGTYVLPWTQYHLDQQNRRDKTAKECQAYWQAQDG